MMRLLLQTLLFLLLPASLAAAMTPSRACHAPDVNLSAVRAHTQVRPYNRRNRFYCPAHLDVWGNPVDTPGKGRKIFHPYNRPNRFTLPALGRFLTPDPARRGHNLYTYPTDPVNLWDPMGLATLEDLVKKAKKEGRLPFAMVWDELSLTQAQVKEILTKFSHLKYSTADNLSPGEIEEANKMFWAFSGSKRYEAYALYVNRKRAKLYVSNQLSRGAFGQFVKMEYYMFREFNPVHYLIEKGIAVGLGIAKMNMSPSADSTAREPVTGDVFDVHSGIKDMLFYISFIMLQQELFRAAGSIKSNALRPVGYRRPLGFKDDSQFELAISELKEALKREGVYDYIVGVRGSSVRGVSIHKKTVFDEGIEPSDIDVWFESEIIATKVNSGIIKTNRVGMANPRSKKFLNTFPELARWNKRWSHELGRKVSVAGWKPNSVPRGSYDIIITMKTSKSSLLAFSIPIDLSKEDE